MANRDFETWFSTMRDTVATWTYYTDFPKVYRNVDSVKVELNILNSLIGSQDIENDFRKLVTQYPNIMRAIPILIAKRESEIKIKDANKEYCFNFKRLNYSIDEYITLLSRSGIFDLIKNHVIGSLVDYVTGVEVGLDSNARKNRTGDAMEDLVESYLIKAGLIKGETYFKEMYKSEVERRFGVDLSGVKDEVKKNGKKAEKRFDFVVIKNGIVYGCECNFYSGGGSKLNETARSYKEIAIETKDTEGFKFVWFTDGIGWKDARRNLEETFDVLDELYNLNELDTIGIDKLLK